MKKYYRRAGEKAYIEVKILWKNLTENLYTVIDVGTENIADNLIEVKPEDLFIKMNEKI